MPQVWWYEGKLVRRREQSKKQKGMVSILLAANTPGDPGVRITVTQESWARKSQSVFYEAGQKPTREELLKLMSA